VNARTAARIAWTTAALSGALGIGGLVTDRLAGLGMETSIVYGFPIAWALSLSLIGALVVSRQPGNALGWVFSLVGALLTFNFAGSVYAALALTGGLGSWPAGLAIAWLTSGWLWIPISALLVIFVPLLFPTGRALSPRWRFPAWFAVAFIVLAGISNALMPGPLASIPRIRNPLGLAGQAARLNNLGNLSGILLLVAVAGAVGSLVVRFRRARGQERQQLKWFLYGGVLFVVPSVLHGFVLPKRIHNLLFPLFLPTLPISIGIANPKCQVTAKKVRIGGTIAPGIAPT